MKRNIVILNSCLILILGLFSIDLYNPALPEIADKLSITDGQSQTLVVFYLLGFSISQLIYGPISDKHGRKPIILFSLLVASLFNLLTATAESYSSLVFFRFLTGIGAGGCPVISRAILSDSFKDKVELSKSLTIFSMASQISPALAPILGGIITQYKSWEYNFIALFFITISGFVFIFISLKETLIKAEPKIKKIHGFRILMLDRDFMIYSLVSAILFSITIGYFTASPFIFQKQFYFNVSKNGFIFIIYSLGIVLGSWLTKRNLNKIKPERMLILSLLFLCLFSFFTFMVSNYISSILFIIYSFFIGLGCGLSSPLLLGISLYGHQNLAGTGSALQGALKMFGASITLLILSKGGVTTTNELMLSVLIMSTICFIFILFTKLVVANKNSN